MREYPKDKGITLVIAIIIVSTLAVVGFSLSSLVGKEIGISSTIRESLKAIYVSDSGIECARYWATKNGKYFPENGNPESGFEEIRCGNQTFDLDSLYQGGNYDFSLTINGSLAEISVNKERPDAESLITNLMSVGYNRDSGDPKVQAFREYRIEGSFEDGRGGAKDIVIAIDTSGSMGNSGRGQRDLRECTRSSSRRIDCAILATREFIGELLQPDSDRRVSVVSAARGLRCTDWSIYDPDQNDWCDPYDSGNSVFADERLDVGLVGWEDRNIYLGPEGLLAYRSRFDTQSYRGDGTNYQVPALFALAELLGKEVVPRSEICNLNRAETRISSCDPDTFPMNVINIGSGLTNDYSIDLSMLRDLPNGGRDRPDGEFPDAFIFIGDFGITTFYDDDWTPYNGDLPARIGSGWYGYADTYDISKKSFAGVLKEMTDQGIEIYLVSIRNSLVRSTFNRLDSAGVNYHLYEREDYNELGDVLINEVLVDLESSSFIPVTEK